MFRTFLGDFTPDRLDSRSLQTIWEWKNRVLLEEYYIFNVAIPLEVEREQSYEELLPGPWRRWNRWHVLVQEGSRLASVAARADDERRLARKGRESQRMRTRAPTCRSRRSTLARSLGPFRRTDLQD